MKNRNKLVTTLYIISKLSFWFVILFSTIILSFDIFTNDGQIENFYTSAHVSKGYPISAKIQFNIPDTLIEFKGNNMSGSYSLNTNNKLGKRFKKIQKDSTITKTYKINTTSINNDFEDITNDFYKLNTQNLSSEIEININPKDKLFKLILVLKNYLSLIILIFITYHLQNIFNQLKINFHFDSQINRRIKLIGYSIIIFQIIIILISIYIKFNISRIEFEHFIYNIENSMFRFMTLYVEMNFNLIPIFFGFSLLVLSKLLEYGSGLQEENELTI